MTITLDLQIAIQDKTLPSEDDFKKWVDTAFDEKITGIICIRIVDEAEITQMNSQFRHKAKPTNILTFPYLDDSHEHEKNPLLGDLAICASIIEQEAAEQKIDLMAHWAHIVIHGCLHVLGYDHQTDKEADDMEKKEADLLSSLGYNLF